jgi:hypothetical protein
MEISMKGDLTTQSGTRDYSAFKASVANPLNGFLLPSTLRFGAHK